MSDFEYLFTFYGLLLGLAIANVATGFADLWRSRKAMTPGLATPLLGVFILLAAAHQWVSFWSGRESLTMGPWELLISIGVAFPYIFVSHGMFPREQDRWTSLEEYYLAHSSVLMGVLLIPPLAGLSYNGVLHGAWPSGPDLIFTAVRIAVPLTLIFVKRSWAHRASLALLSLTMLTGIFLFFE
jgi:hypothetical protein